MCFALYRLFDILHSVPSSRSSTPSRSTHSAEASSSEGKRGRGNKDASANKAVQKDAHQKDDLSHKVPTTDSTTTASPSEVSKRRHRGRGQGKKEGVTEDESQPQIPFTHSDKETARGSSRRARKCVSTFQFCC